MYIDTQMSSPAHKAEVQRTASSAGCGVSPKTSFSLSAAVGTPKSRSAENAVLCRGLGPAHLGDAPADSQRTPFPFLPPKLQKAGVQRTQSFAGVRGVPENPLLPLLPP